MALFRSVNRTTPTNNDLILVTNDADADLISKDILMLLFPNMTIQKNNILMQPWKT
jgi:hypothetical protein